MEGPTEGRSTVVEVEHSEWGADVANTDGARYEADPSGPDVDQAGGDQQLYGDGDRAVLLVESTEGAAGGGRGGGRTALTVTYRAAAAILIQQLTMERLWSGLRFFTKTVVSWAIKRALDRLAQ